MHRSARTLVLTILAVYFVALGAFMAYSVQQFPTREVLAIFQRTWIVTNGLYLFIDRLIPVQLTAVVLARLQAWALRDRRPPCREQPSRSPQRARAG